MSTDAERYLTINLPQGSVLRIEPVVAAIDDDDTVECVADNGIGEAATATAQLHVYADGQG